MEFHKILIAIDKSQSAEKVAKSGLELAKQFNSEIALVTIIDESANESGDQPTAREIEDMRGHNLNHSQRQVIEKVFKDFPIKSFVEDGEPAQAIVKIAELWGADVIVMGTHGRKGLSHLIMGSVAEEVIRNSKKTMVVIPISEA
ncbi:universal stress protein [Pedobacter changchengzhani]|uniref:Universal stress protein n=1 Tax=Pedobacter changchengzhani TaxID=2529274 RepID=A0A4R5MMF6_9SPHI|nr:universal stress protein [Pedobacter changchengzhani]TDG36465.1 universal stress protein [Pedobacter changchengzhani]